MLPSPLPYIRTASIVIAGALITWAISYIPQVAVFLLLLVHLGIDRTAENAAVAAIIMFLYYALAKELGKRWPAIEKWMLNAGTTAATVIVTSSRRKLGAIVDLPLDPRNFDFGSTFTLPPTPAGFVGTKRKPVRMLGNATVGDCVIAMMMHAIIVGTGTAKFTTKLAIQLYSAITGYVPGDESTDQGTDPIAAVKFWQKNGIVDSKGVKHELIGWATIKVGNFDQLRAALSLEGVFVGVSLKLPYSAQDQFPSRKWTVVAGSRSAIEGGHEVLADWDDETNTGLGTWASTAKADRPFMSLYSTLWIVLVTDGAPAGIQEQVKAAIAAIRAA